LTEFHLCSVEITCLDKPRRPAGVILSGKLRRYHRSVAGNPKDPNKTHASPGREPDPVHCILPAAISNQGYHLKRTPWEEKAYMIA
jgi:hypothetical protein